MLVSPVVFRVGREVVARDAIFYTITILSFIIALIYSSYWGLSIAVIFIGIYFWYVSLIIDQTQKYKLENGKMLGEKISVTMKMVSAFFNMIVMGVAAYFLTEHAIIISNILKIPALIVGFSIVAVTTSIPDTIIAVTNARKGTSDDAMSNVFGSNIFNILIALGFPLLLSVILTGKGIDIVSGGVDLVIALIVATIVVLYFTVDDYILTKRDAVIMLSLYVLFIAYLFFKSIWY